MFEEDAGMWKLYALKAYDGWQGALRYSSETEAVIADAMHADAVCQEDGTILQVLSSEAMGRLIRVVRAGRAEPLVLSEETQAYLGRSSRAAWREDPVLWWQESSRGDHLFRVAGEAAYRAGRNTLLHREVARAACSCVRLVLLDKEAYFPEETHPRKVLELVRNWCDGCASEADVRDGMWRMLNTPETAWAGVRTAADRAMLEAKGKGGDLDKASDAVWSEARFLVAATEAVGRYVSDANTAKASWYERSWAERVVTRCADAAKADTRRLVAETGLSRSPAEDAEVRTHSTVLAACADVLRDTLTAYDVLVHLHS